MSNAIVLAPSMTLEEAGHRRNELVTFCNDFMKDGVDYGAIPGTTKKKVLFKPGAEKLCSFFGLVPRFEEVTSTVDFDKGLFYFRYRCQLFTRDGVLLGEGIGSCNSYESKYRYRHASRVCPSCGEPAIMRSRYPEEVPPEKRGWYCNAKSGGCNAKFPADTEEIASQEEGRVENTDPADQLNTIDKMAAKRALVAATLIVTGASEFYTQDLEDWRVDVVEGEYAVVDEGAPGKPEPPPPTPPPPTQRAPAKTAPRRSARPPTQKAGNGDGGEAGSEWHTRTKVIAAVRKNTSMEVPHIINRLKKGEREKRIKWSDSDADVIAYATDPDSYSPPPADAPDAEPAPEGEATQPELDKWFGAKEPVTNYEEGA